MSDEKPRRWHIDHSIPIALVTAIVCQTLVGTWWISSFETKTVLRLDNLEMRQKGLDLLPERLARQEVVLEANTAILKEIRSDMRDLAKRPMK